MFIANVEALWGPISFSSLHNTLGLVTRFVVPICMFLENPAVGLDIESFFVEVVA